MRLNRPPGPVTDIEAATPAQQPASVPEGKGAGAPLRLARVGLLWFAEGLVGPTQPFQSTGAHVAAAGLTRALAEHSSVASIDIFAPIGDVDACRRQLDGLPPDAPGAQSPVAGFFPTSDLPARFQAHGYDVVHDLGTGLTTGSSIRSRLCDTIFPVTCSQHGISYSFLLHGCFIPLLTAQIYPCDAIVCLSEASKRAMERRLHDVAEHYSRAWEQMPPPLPRLELIPWGVDTVVFAPQDRGTARRQLNLPQGRPIILCLGRVRIQDKMDWTPLLLAFDHVSKSSQRDPLLVLAGATFSDYSEQLLGYAGQLGIRDRLRTFFNLPPACLPSLYAACDVFVSPVDSPSESFGLTVVEAMACGRPVVASDWDGYKELIVDGETGFKVRTDWADCLGELNEMAPFLPMDQEHLHVGQSVSVNVAEMAACLKRLLENSELCAQMGNRGRARVQALYSWPVIVRQWEALWQELRCVASSISPTQRDRLDYLKPCYFQQFSHYATRIIRDETPIHLTPRGRQTLAGKAPLFLHPWARGFLEPQYLQGALLALKPAGWLGVGLFVRDLVDVLHRRYGLSRDRALMHLMWLAKYDLVTLGGSEPPDR